MVTGWWMSTRTRSNPAAVIANRASCERMVTLVAAGLIADYDLEVLGKLGVSLNVFPS